MYKLPLIPVGDAFGVVFPEELLARLNIKEGDTLKVTQLPYNGVALTLEIGTAKA